MFASSRRSLLSLVAALLSIIALPTPALGVEGAMETRAVQSPTLSTQSIALSDGLPATQVVAGSRLSCALSSGSVYCWGSADYGAVGNGATPMQGFPTNNTVDYPSLVVDGSDGFVNSGVTAIAAGGANACAINAGSPLRYQ